MGQLWSSTKENILDSRRLTKLFMPHRLTRREHPLTGNDRSAMRLRVVINLVLIIVFGGSALVQLNDPDPALWIPVYAFPCFACVVDIFSGISFELLMGSVLEMLHLVYCVVVLAVTCIYVAIEYDQMDAIPRGEYMRELLGLFVVLLWHLHIAVSLHRDVTGQRKLETGAAYTIINICLLAIGWISTAHDNANSRPPNLGNFNQNDTSWRSLANSTWTGMDTLSHF